jgi:hypothetical protein
MLYRRDTTPKWPPVLFSKVDLDLEVGGEGLLTSVLYLEPLDTKLLY